MKIAKLFYHLQKPIVLARDSFYEGVLYFCSLIYYFIFYFYIWKYKCARVCVLSNFSERLAGVACCLSSLSPAMHAVGKILMFITCTLLVFFSSRQDVCFHLVYTCRFTLPLTVCLWLFIWFIQFVCRSFATCFSSRQYVCFPPWPCFVVFLHVCGCFSVWLVHLVCLAICFVYVRICGVFVVSLCREM